MLGAAIKKIRSPPQSTRRMPTNASKQQSEATVDITFPRTQKSQVCRCVCAATSRHRRFGWAESLLNINALSLPSLLRILSLLVLRNVVAWYSHSLLLLLPYKCTTLRRLQQWTAISTRMKTALRRKLGNVVRINCRLMEKSGKTWYPNFR